MKDGRRPAGPSIPPVNNARFRGGAGGLNVVGFVGDTGWWNRGGFLTELERVHTR